MKLLTELDFWLLGKTQKFSDWCGKTFGTDHLVLARIALAVSLPSEIIYLCLTFKKDGAPDAFGLLYVVISSMLFVVTVRIERFGQDSLFANLAVEKMARIRKTLLIGVCILIPLILVIWIINLSMGQSIFESTEPYFWLSEITIPSLSAAAYFICCNPPPKKKSVVKDAMEKVLNSQPRQEVAVRTQ